MAASIVSSIIFFLLFIILSHSVDGKVFAAQMEHRKLRGAKEAMTTRRNLEENGNQSSKIDPKRKEPQHSGQKNTQHNPDTQPNKATAQGNHITYEALQRHAVYQNKVSPSNCTMYGRCHRFIAPQLSPPPSSSKDTQGLGH